METTNELLQQWQPHHHSVQSKERYEISWSTGYYFLVVIFIGKEVSFYFWLGNFFFSSYVGNIISHSLLLFASNSMQLDCQVNDNRITLCGKTCTNVAAAATTMTYTQPFRFLLSSSMLIYSRKMNRILTTLNEKKNSVSQLFDIAFKARCLILYR